MGHKRRLGRGRKEYDKAVGCRRQSEGSREGEKSADAREDRER